MTNAERIIALLRKSPGLDDDELSSHTGIRPRQQINQICRRLEAQGLIRRVTGPRGKVVNLLVDSHSGPRKVSASSTQAEGRPAKKQVLGASILPARRATTARLDELIRLDRRKTLIVIPCSGKKAWHDRSVNPGPSIVDGLPSSLASRLLAARRQLAPQIALDESVMVPAWQRYAGMLYQCGLPNTARTKAALKNIMIISGGYGLLLATEAIGTYEAVFKPGHWPAGLLSEVLLACIRKRQLESVVAFVSATTGYRGLLNQIRWEQADGLQSVYIVSPESTTGAMVKAPRAQGEALSRFIAETLQPDFVSSDGLQLEVTLAYGR